MLSPSYPISPTTLTSVVLCGFVAVRVPHVSVSRVSLIRVSIEPAVSEQEHKYVLMVPVLLANNFQLFFFFFLVLLLSTRSTEPHTRHNILICRQLGAHGAAEGFSYRNLVYPLASIT
jgi:hypothetical protein